MTMMLGGRGPQEERMRQERVMADSRSGRTDTTCSHLPGGQEAASAKVGRPAQLRPPLQQAPLTFAGLWCLRALGPRPDCLSCI